MPVARRMRPPSAFIAAYSSSALFPTPGSPRSTSAPLRPSRPPASSRSSPAHSADLPMSMPPIVLLGLLSPQAAREAAPVRRRLLTHVPLWDEDELALRRCTVEQLVRAARFGEGQALRDDGVDLA